MVDSIKEKEKKNTSQHSDHAALRIEVNNVAQSHREKLSHFHIWPY